ncbi:MACPF domain-containing proteinisoform X2 [Iris pallida]|uniref:MACPF domain-containing proteinisoform X2 n=1 Tax=Iris pallida TaxID=29817 RepID=A0AAX6GEI3_IRIPA|nr:MACPF domain-containing proteinisoform X2 [Iris pallida]
MSGAVERGLRCLGRGFDVTCDFRAKHCKGRERLVVLNEEETVELALPGFGSVPDVSVDVKLDKGDRIRYRSDVLAFNQMSELFNQRSSLPGKIPSGYFNSMFGLDGSSWARQAAETKCLAMDGYIISLFNLHIDRRPLVLSDHVVGSVPTTWDPASLARFIENFGTHVIVGLSMGGQDVIHVRQENSSNLSQSEIKQHLDKLGDQLFTGSCTLPPPNWKYKDHRRKVPEAFNVFDPQPTFGDGFTTVSSKDGITVVCSKRGGNAMANSHSEWLLTVPSVPDVINFTFVPITSLLKGVPGTGFLTHAINLYLRYKPPLSELQYFLDFQSHKVWAPLLNELPLGPSSNRSIPSPALIFSLMGPKLYVNTTQVCTGSRPITGMRLHLEGRKNNRLAIHLQHLSDTPIFIANCLKNSSSIRRGTDVVEDRRFYEPVQRRWCSHVCTVPVKYNPEWSTGRSGATAFIVTGAQFHVTRHESTNVLHLKLFFSEMRGCVVGQSRWERGPLGFSQTKTSFFSFSSSGSTERDRQQQQPGPAVVVDSGVFPTGPPVPVHEQKLLRFVDTGHICKGPQDSPGYWLVTGAKLDLEKGKIGIHVKFSLLTLLS